MTQFLGDLVDWVFHGLRMKTLLYWLTWFFKQGWRYWLKRMITKLQAGVLNWPLLFRVDSGLVEKKRYFKNTLKHSLFSKLKRPKDEKVMKKLFA